MLLQDLQLNCSCSPSQHQCLHYKHTPSHSFRSLLPTRKSVSTSSLKPRVNYNITSVSKQIAYNKVLRSFRKSLWLGKTDHPPVTNDVTVPQGIFMNASNAIQHPLNPKAWSILTFARKSAAKLVNHVRKRAVQWHRDR